jgi:protein O-mannosyl-transferase
MRSTRVLPLLVAVMTMLPFLPSLSGEFLNWDDGVGLVTNEAYRGLGWHQLVWMFTNTRLGHYMPLTWLTFGINYVLGGMQPWGYHLVNVLLHGANAALLLLVAIPVLDAARPRAFVSSGSPTTTGDGPIPAVVAGAVLTALTFGLHPQRVEPVAWVTGRPALLSTLFYLIAVLGYLRTLSPAPAPASRGWRLTSLFAFVAAVLSHPLAMTLPLTLLVLDLYPFRRHRTHGWGLLAEKIPYALVALGAAALAALARHRGVMWTEAATRDLATKLTSVGQSLWFYPASFVWPVDLSPLYEMPRKASLLEPRFLLPWIGALATLLLLVRLRRRFPGGLAAWVHMAVVVAPVSGIVHTGIQLGADRYAYQADLGFALLVGYGLTWALLLREQGRLRPVIARAITGTAAFVIIALGLSTWVYAGLWQDSETLWRWAVEIDADCAVCNVNLSEAIVAGAVRQGVDRVPARAAEAEGYARRALALRPDLADGYFNLGTVLAAQHRYDEADVALRAYVERAPWDPAGPSRLGLLRIVQGRPAEAVPFLRRAVAMDPASPMLRQQLADALREHADQLQRSGRASEATALLEETTRLGANPAGRPARSP